jgi:hypothetical protein
MSDNKWVRAAVLAVVDAGLARLTLGERGGFSNARLSWQQPRKRIIPCSRLTEDDQQALRFLAAA